MGKFVSWIALGFFLVIVPALSWYFLSRGFNYRKQMLQEVTPKDSIISKTDSLHLFGSKTTVLILNKDSNTSFVVSGLNEQFKNVKTFQIVAYDTVSPIVKTMPTGYMVEVRQKYSENAFLLVDTSLHIRNVYKNDEVSIRKLIEHIAVVLPRWKEADIEMK
jgi:hypothetical protein